MKRDNKYYIVDAVCGHVGRNNGIIKSFPINADSSKEAAAIARMIPRVKHDYKNAICGVREVSYKEYLIQNKRNDRDAYLTSTNKQMQNAKCRNLEIVSINSERNSYKKPKVSQKKYVNRYCSSYSLEEAYEEAI